MDTAQFWVQAVLQLGVPTVALYFVAKWVSKRIEATDTAAAAREVALASTAKAREEAMAAASEKREIECRTETKKLTQDVRNLEREMRSELVPLVKDCRRSLEQSTVNSRQLVALVAEMRGVKVPSMSEGGIITDGISTDQPVDQRA